MTDTIPAVEDLVVVRESDEYDRELMRGMIIQTHHKYNELPGHTALIAAAEDPLFNPEKYGGIEERAGGTHAVTFQIDGTHCLYARGSAAKQDVGHDNGFATLLTRTIRRLRPRNVRVANFSRLVRQSEMSSDVKKAMIDVRSTLHADGFPLPMTDATSGYMFDVLGIMATVDRQHQLSRLTNGQLKQLREGKWIHGYTAVPLGYRYNPHTKVVTVDAAASSIVRQMLELLADPECTATDIAHALGERGLRTPTQTGGHWTYDTETLPTVTPTNLEQSGPAATCDPKPTIADLKEPAAKVKRWIALLPFYETGVYHFDWKSPLTNVERYSEFDVHPATDTKAAHMRLQYELGLPEGGWAPPQLFERIRAVRGEIAARHPHAAQAREKVLAFCGPLARWEDDHFEYNLKTAANPPSYQLRRRPKPPPESRSSQSVAWKSKNLGELLTTIYASDLHQSIFASTAQAITTGVPAHRLVNVPEYRALVAHPEAALTHHEREHILKNHATKLRRRADLARQSLYEEEDQALRSQIRQEAADLETRARQAERDLHDFASRRQTPPPIEAEGVTCEIDLLSRVLIALSKATGHTPRPVSLLVNKVFHDLRIHPTPLEVSWSVHVHVPVDNGDILVLGPIAGTIPQRSAAARVNRAPGIARELMTSERPIADFAWTERNDGQRERERARGHLAEALDINSLDASKLLSCAVLETRQAIWHLLDPTYPYPAGVDPTFAEHVISQMRGKRKRAVWYDDAGNRRPIANYLLHRGGSAPFEDVEQHLATHGASHNALDSILRSERPCFETHHGPCPPDCTDRRQRHRVLSFTACPHCPPGNWASVVLLVPECPASIICPRCRRMPTEGSPVFPAAYLGLSPQSAKARVDLVSPRSAVEDRNRQRRVPQPGTTAHMRTWAREDGHTVPTRGPLADNLRAAYSAAHPDLEPPTAPRARTEATATAGSQRATHYRPNPTRVRQWAADQGSKVATHGRLPQKLVRNYLMANLHSEVGLYEVRQWARSVGLDVANSGTLPPDIIDAYLGFASTDDVVKAHAEQSLAGKVRQWAKENDKPAPARGRIPKYLLDAYRRAQETRPVAPQLRSR